MRAGTGTRLHVKCTLLFCDFDQKLVLSTGFSQIHAKLHANPFSGSQVLDAYGRTDRMNLIAAQQDYERPLKGVTE
jgi:hypothetical protein